MSQPTVKYLKDYQAPAFLIDTTELDFDLTEDVTVVTNTMALRRNPDHADTQAPLELDGVNIKLLEIELDGQALKPSDYQLTDEKLTLTHVPEQFTLKITTQCYPQHNKALEGLYKSGDIFCTQCESHGFRKITYYLDRPDVMSIFTTKLTADQAKYPALLSNGNKVDSHWMKDGRHYAVWHDPHKKPAYLFALVAGRLAIRKDEFVTMSGRKVELEIYTKPEDILKTEYAMEAVKRSMKWDEERFGREYDLDVYMIVAVPDFNMGAMENKGLNIFNTKYILADAQTATDKDFEMVEAVIGHEYFHNWTGNRVTCRDWFQLSLKEGLTVFRDQEFTSDLHSRAVKRIEDVKIIRSAQFAEDASPMAHPIRPASYIEMNNFYTVTVYHKGAEIIRMQYTLAGHEGFRKGMDLYFERHDGQAVTCDDFVAAIADANDLDLTQFKRWYSQAGTPVVSVEDAYDASKQTYTLRLRQHCAPTADKSPKEPFVIPVKTALVGQDGRDMSVTLNQQNKTEHLLLLTEQEQTFVFRNVAEKPTPSLLRDFSAPVKLNYAYTDEQLAFLMAHDRNEFNRWDASQTLATRVIMALREQHNQGEDLVVPEHYLNAYRELLASTKLDKSLQAMALQLPTEKTLAEAMTHIDVDGLYAAREHLLHTLSEHFQDELMALYDANNTQADYAYEHQQVAQRDLKNTCLSLLAKTATPAYRERALAQFKNADNMTDQLAALSVLANDADEMIRQDALASFYAQWQDEALVMDKWLSLQAAADLPETLDNVKALMQNKVFSLDNPNKVFALLGGFCLNNMTQFHRPDGAGYTFIAEQIIALNHNPQVAARLVRSLMSWYRYDENRQTKMKAALEYILATPNLAKDVYEIASKSLEAGVGG